MRCLYCYKELQGGTAHDFHEACSRKIFGTPQAPVLPYTEGQMLQLAGDVVRSHVAVTGVQAKLSLSIAPGDSGQPAAPARFTIVGLWGTYILKPPTGRFPFLPEVEDLTMHLAEIAGIDTVPHSLIRLASGSPAYITKRIDRAKGNVKLPMEDMCQLTGRLTEDKYKGSYEQTAKAILKYAAHPGLDTVNFYEQVLFSFLTGNADMHLKNFSLIRLPGAGHSLAPAYDMVASALLLKEDEEELALALNGKKRKLTRADFDKAILASGIIDNKGLLRMYDKFAGAIDGWMQFIGIGFIPEAMKEEYMALITARAKRLSIY